METMKKLNIANTWIPPGEIEPENEEQANMAKMKVVAFKLIESQCDFIDESKELSISASVSEFCRTAIMEFITDVLDERLSIMEIDDYRVKANDPFQDKYSRCSKLPVNFQKTIDMLVKENPERFDNRTQLIRTAIEYSIDRQRSMMEYFKTAFGIDPYVKNS